MDDGEYEDIIDDITQEIQEKYGEVRQCHLPRPADNPAQVRLRNWAVCCSAARVMRRLDDRCPMQSALPGARCALPPE